MTGIDLHSGSTWTPGDPSSPRRWRDLSALFDPRSVAIVGASDDPAKWGNWIARRALNGAHRRDVILVNRKGGVILGRESYRSLSDAPGPVELVVVAVPSAGFDQAVDEAIAAGARAIVGISAGLGESGQAGRARERAVAERVRAAGAVLLGPNCLGVFDAGAELELSSNGFPSGRIGLVSQSGNLALELALLAEDVGLGFSRFASLGNQADLDVAELVAALATHDATQVIAIYCEDFRDGRAFASAAATAVSNGKPVVLMTVGQSQASVRAARSHTGALASDSAAIDAACRAAGIDRVTTPQELINLAQGLLSHKSPRGRRIAIVGDGGGHGVVAAEVAHGFGLAVPALGDELSRQLGRCLPPTASTRNPIDFAGGGEQDIYSFERTTRLLLESDEVDGVLMTGYFGGYGEYSDMLAGQELEVAQSLGSLVGQGEKPFIAHTMHAGTPAARLLRDAHVPVYRTIEAAASVLTRLIARQELPPRGVPTLPDPAPPVQRDDYWSARELIASAGVPFVAARAVRSVDEAFAAATAIGYPVVLKALGSAHKSDSGGVVVGIRDEDALERSFTELQCRLETRRARHLYSIERMARLETGVELVIGARWDHRFGPIALVGMGGVFTELLRDVAVALAPLDEEQAVGLIGSLRGAPLLKGYRGRQAVDVSAAARALVDLSALAAAHPDIAEMEVNPLLVSNEGALGLDARVILHGNEERDGDA